jgi:response regulator RpfG family c-di-GMP phosphodiesterase
VASGSSIRHLVKRFVTSLSRRALSVEQLAWVRKHLLEDEFSLWTQMVASDQRHSLVVAQRFVALKPDVQRDHVAAALLHDVGKIESHVGITMRVVATLIGPRTKRLRAYHDHETIGLDLCIKAHSTTETLRVLRADSTDEISLLIHRADNI